jgi:hypothetical protein
VEEVRGQQSEACAWNLKSGEQSSWQPTVVHLSAITNSICLAPADDGRCGYLITDNLMMTNVPGVFGRDPGPGLSSGRYWWGRCGDHQPGALLAARE